MATEGISSVFRDGGSSAKRRKSVTVDTKRRQIRLPPDGVHVPNILGIGLDRAVGRETARGGDVAKRLAVPLGAVRIVCDGAAVLVAIRIKIGKTHIGVGDGVAAVDEIVRDVREIFSAKSAIEAVDDTAQFFGIVIDLFGAVAVSPHFLDLIGVKTEDIDIALTDGIVDLDVCAVKRAHRNSTVHHELHVTRTARLLAREGDLLGDLRGGDKHLSHADVVILHEDDLDAVAGEGIFLKLLTEVVGKLDQLLSHDVSGRRLCAENKGLVGNIGVGIGAYLVIEGEDLKNVKKLSLVLVHALDLHVKDGGGVDDSSHFLLGVSGKAYLIVMLDLIKTLKDGTVIGIFGKTGKLGGIVAEAVSDAIGEQRGKPRVCGAEPAAINLDKKINTGNFPVFVLSL